jgi:hypothetical protein
MKVAALVGLILVVMITPVTSGQQPAPPIDYTNEQYRPVPVPQTTPHPTPGIIVDTQERPQPSRPEVVVPTAPLIAVEVPEPIGGSHSLTGAASWYCRAGRSPCMAAHPDSPGADLYAAAGPRLRVAMGGGVATTAPDPWRNKLIYVNGVPLRLADWCACLRGTPNEKVIDLYWDAWVLVGNGGNVTITWRAP